MVGVLFLITLPTCQEEKRQREECTKAELKERPSHVHQMGTLRQTTESDDSQSSTRAGIFRGKLKKLYHASKTDMHVVERALNESEDRTTSASNGKRPSESRSTVWTNVLRYLNAKRKLFSSNERFNTKRQADLPLDLPEDAFMECVLVEILKKLQISNVIWTQDQSGCMHQVNFTMPLNEKYELMLEYLSYWGFGERARSMISVLKCILTKDDSQAQEKKEKFSAQIIDVEMSSIREDCNEGTRLEKQSTGKIWKKFMNSVRCRLNVTQTVREVRRDASITFDSVVLLFSAALLTAMGLIDDNFIFLASSMLISPLMGPIIAAIFGTVIRDRSLTRQGQINEILGLLFVTVLGLIFGFGMCAFDSRLSRGEGVTLEMLSRTETRNLWFSTLAAVPSGAAAAIGILAGNMSSVIGVAISASLLPPAVNAGMLWSFAIVCKIFEGKNHSVFKQILPQHKYSSNQVTELIILGGISMCITIFNVVFVYLLGVLVLKVKEVAPRISPKNREFWKHDIKVARKLSEHRSLNAGNIILDEFGNLPSEEQNALGIDTDILRDIASDDSFNKHTWSPSQGLEGLHDSMEPRICKTYFTVHRLECLYNTVTKHPAWEWKRRPLSDDADKPSTSYCNMTNAEGISTTSDNQKSHRTVKSVEYADGISLGEDTASTFSCHDGRQYPHVSTLFTQPCETKNIAVNSQRISVSRRISLTSLPFSRMTQATPPPPPTPPPLPPPLPPPATSSRSPSVSNDVTDTAIRVIAERGGRAFIITPVETRSEAEDQQKTSTPQEFDA